MIELEQKYLDYLQELEAPSKIPYIECVPELTEKIPVTYETTSFPGTVLPGSPTGQLYKDTNGFLKVV